MDDLSDLFSSLSGQQVSTESDAGKRDPTRSPSPSASSIVLNSAIPPPSECLDSVWVPLIPSTPGAAPPSSTDAPGAHDIPLNDRASMFAPKNAGLSTLPLSIANVHLVAKNVEQARDSRVVAAEEKVWKEINEKCGGRIGRYHEMTIEQINSGRNGVIIPPEAAIPEKSELVGDKKPGYEDMTLTEKSFAWWTKKQMKIFNDTVAEEINQAIQHSAEDCAPGTEAPDEKSTRDTRYTSMPLGPVFLV